MTGYQVEVVELEPQHSAVVRGHVTVDGLPGFLGGAYGEVMGVLSGQHLSPSGPPFARYEQTADGFEVEAGFPVAGTVTPSGRVAAGELPGGPAACVMHHGSYDEVAAAYEAAGEWLATNGYVPAGEAWESYLDGPDVPEPRTLVHFPCRKRLPNGV